MIDTTMIPVLILMAATLAAVSVLIAWVVRRIDAKMEAERADMTHRAEADALVAAPQEPAVADLPQSPSAAYAQGWREGWIAASQE